MRAKSERSPAWPVADLGQLRKVRPKEMLIRFGLGAGISVVAGIIGLTISPRFGGSFLAFPSILPASLTLLQEEAGTRRADRDAIGAVLGAVAMVVFAMVGEAGFGRIEPFTVLLLALAGWAVVACGLYAVLAWLRPQDCDRNRD